MLLRPTSNPCNPRAPAEGRRPSGAAGWLVSRSTLAGKRQPQAGTAQRVRVAVAECRHNSHGTDEPGARPVDPSPRDLLAAHLAVPPAKLRALLDKEPGILNQPPARVAARMQRLAQVMGVPMQQVLMMVTRHPGVLSAPPSLILQKAQDMLDQMQLPRAAIMPLLARQPEFLEVPTEKLASRCTLLASSLCVEVLDTATALTRLPPSSLFAVLGLRPTFISVRIMELGRLLQVGDVSPGTPVARLPGAPLSDDPTISDDGRIAFTPLLMRSPLPGAAAGLSAAQWDRACGNLRRAATAIERRASEAGRLSPGPSAVASLLLKRPQLLLASMRGLSAAYATLLDLLQVPPMRLLSFLHRQPELLLLPPRALQGTWAALRHALGLTPQALAVRLLQQPQLLLLPEHAVPQRLHELGAAMGWGGREARRAVRNQPQLLAASPAHAAYKVTAIAAMLRLPGRGEAHDMARRQPALLTLSVPTLLRNLRGLHGALLDPAAAAEPAPLQQPRAQPSPQPPRRPATQQQHAAQHGSSPPNSGRPGSSAGVSGSSSHPPVQAQAGPKAAGSSSSGSRSSAGSATFPSPDVVQAAVAHPTLLTLPPRTLAAKLEFLARLMQMDRSSTRLLLLKRPVLLEVSKANLQFRVNELQLIFDLPLGAAVKLLALSPDLVLQTPPLVLRSWLCQLAQPPSEASDAPGGVSGSGSGSARGASIAPSRGEELVQAQLLRLLKRGNEAALRRMLRAVEAFSAEPAGQVASPTSRSRSTSAPLAAAGGERPSWQCT